MVLLQQMLIFMILMAVGIIARKRGIITPDNQKQFSALVVDVANPALILSGAMGEGEKLSPGELLLPVGLAVGLYVVLVILGLVLPGLIGYRGTERRVANLMTVFSNIGFMGMPLVSSVYGSEALIYVTLFIVPFNILLYSYGMRVISGGEGGAGLRRMLNPGLIAGVITVGLYLADVKLPQFVTQPVAMLSDITGPLSMMIIGVSMLDIDLRGIVKNVRLILFSLVKMIVIPVLLLLILKSFVHDELLLSVCLVMLATPAASIVVMLAKQHDEAAYREAAMGVALTTVMSVATVPLVSLITGVG